MFVPILGDGISGEGFLILGAIYGILPLLAIVLIEWPIWRVAARLRGQPVLPTCLGANLLSAVVAIPLAILLDAQTPSWVPKDLHIYERAFLSYAIIRYVIYFLMSVGLEAAAFVRRFPKIGKTRVLKAAVYANVVSYLIIAPVYYELTKPTLRGAVFTADTSWAPESPQRVTYIDKATGHLMSCDLRGGSRSTTVAAAMDSYLFMPDKIVVVYRHGSELWWAKGEQRERITNGLPDGRGAPMCVADLDPSGRFVAYAVRVLSQPAQSEDMADIHVWDADRKVDRVVRTRVKGWGPVVRWADVGTRLLIGKYCNAPPDEEIAVGGDGGEIESKKLTRTEPRVAGCFAPLAQDRTRQRPYQIEFADQAGDWHVTSWSVLTNRYASVARGAKWKEPGSIETICLGDNPGLYVVWARVREWGDFAFVPGTEVAVVEDQTNHVLYLVDPASGRVGKLAEGSDFILERDRYRRGVSDNGLGPWALSHEPSATTRP